MFDPMTVCVGISDFIEGMELELIDEEGPTGEYVLVQEVDISEPPFITLVTTRGNVTLKVMP